MCICSYVIGDWTVDNSWDLASEKGFGDKLYQLVDQDRIAFSRWFPSLSSLQYFDTLNWAGKAFGLQKCMLQLYFKCLILESSTHNLE